MNPKLRIVAVTKEKATELSLSGLTPVGGKNSSGIALEGLKHEGDYLILAHVGNAISLHPLRGNKGRPTSLQADQVFQLDDLLLFVEEKKSSATQENSDLEKLRKVLVNMAANANTKKPLEEVLKLVMGICGHHQGLVISQGLNGQYEILAAENLDATQPWLSESLIQQSIRSKEPVILQNVIGSGFDTKKSLMATKFLSVFCWPLVVHGNTIGALLSGSPKPYGGSFESVKDKAEVYVNLAALFLDFHLRELRLKKEIHTYREQMGSGPFLTENPIMQEVCELGRKVAGSDLSVLIQGETGVGKEVLSRWIHQQSNHKTGPFIAVNCAAIPADLLESTLFGHKRGAFTGAVSDHTGKILQAHGGTLFLDEIGDLPHSLQAKLLRVLQEKTIEPVGSQKSIPVNVRILAASHKNIRSLAEQGKFRDDLYYRIAQVTLCIPPLRERLGDIRLLAQQFLKEVEPQKQLTQDAWSWLLSQSWQGNVRELKSAVQRAAILSNGNEIHAKHFFAGTQTLPFQQSQPQWLGAGDLEAAKQAFVMQKIQQALEITSGNRTRAAELLGVTSRTLFRYLEQKTMTGQS